MKLTKSLITASMLIALTATPVYAAKTPKSIIADPRVKEVIYDPNQVYEVTANYGYQTSIEFAPGEQIKVVSLGDTIAWQTVPYENSLFIKPVEPNAATNMTIITSAHRYYFKLHSASATSKITFVVRFVYANHIGGLVSKGGNATAQLDDAVTVDPEKLNMDYGISGDLDAIPLKRVFDDGQFTYFLFDKDTEIPSFYEVRPDGTEAVINTHREGNYMVAERTAKRFTLRSGAAHICVKNSKGSFFSFGSSGNNKPDQYKHNTKPE